MDYEALAKEYGGVAVSKQPPVDYEALAKEYGGVAVSKQPSRDETAKSSGTQNVSATEEPTEAELAAASRPALDYRNITRKKGPVAASSVDAPVVAPAVAQPVAQAAPYKNRREALDDAVNLLEENQDFNLVANTFAKIGITPEQIAAHGKGRKSPYFTQQTIPETNVRGPDLGPATLSSSDIKPENQSIFRQAADYPLNLAQGAVSGIRMLAEAIPANQAGTNVSTNLRTVEKYIGSLMSAQAREDGEEISRIMSEAEGQGVADQVKSGIQALSVAPVKTVVNALGTSAPIILAGLAAAVAGAPAAVATGVGLGLGALSGAGTIKGTIYEETKQALLSSGVDKYDAEERAKRAQQYNGKNLDQILLGAVITAGSSITGMQPALAKILAAKILNKVGSAETIQAAAADITKRSYGQISKELIKAGLIEGTPEFIQAFQEKVAGNIAKQKEGFDVKTYSGAVAAGTLEGLTGIATGSGIKGLEIRSDIKEQNLTPSERVAKELAKGVRLTNFSPEAQEQIAIDRLRTGPQFITPQETRARGVQADQLLSDQGFQPRINLPTVSKESIDNSGGLFRRATNPLENPDPQRFEPYYDAEGTFIGWQNKKVPQPAGTVSKAVQPSVVQPPVETAAPIPPALQDPDLILSDEFEQPNLSVTPVTLTSQEAPAADQIIAPVTQDAKTPETQEVKPPAEIKPAKVEPEQFEKIKPIFQNRNRSDAGSVIQMRGIAADPNYGMISVGRGLGGQTAPVIAGGNIPESSFGRSDYAISAAGKRIPIRYAVVDASAVLTSNKIDGTVNPAYAEPSFDGPVAIAGNGRITGLSEGYKTGAAQKPTKNNPAYFDEFLSDDQHQIDPEAIKAIPNPILVRVMGIGDITPDIGDQTNISSTRELSPSEKAANDARRINFDQLKFDENGLPTKDSVKAFILAMPETEQGGLLANGIPNTDADMRFRRALFAKAYNDPGLINFYAEGSDTSRLIISALAQLAPVLARVEGALDIRGIVVDAAKMMIEGSNRNISLADLSKQQDLAVHPATNAIIQLFAENPRSNKNAIAAIKAAADFAYSETEKKADMFGEPVRASFTDVINRMGSNEKENTGNVGDTQGRGAVAGNAERPAAQSGAAPISGAVEENRPVPSLELKGETEAEIRAREAKAKEASDRADREAAEADAKQKAEAERKEIAERSKNVEFDLTPTEQVDKDKQAAIDKKAAKDALARQGDVFGDTKDFKVGDSVRVGNVAGVVVGVDGDYVKVHPINADNPKAYQRVQAASITFVARPNKDITQAKSEFEGFGEFETELHVNKEELVQRIGQNMYGAALAEIVIKEGVQNSFDAIKAQIYSKYGTLVGKHIGHLEIIVDQEKRTITLKDDGTGMLPEVVDSAFLTIAGSDKAGLPPELSSGGLGMAKMGILMGASRIQLETTKDGKVTTLDTTNKELAAKRFKLKVLPAAKNLHGTTLTLTIPKTYIKDNGDEQQIYFPFSPDYITALNKPLIGPIEVKYTDATIAEGTTVTIPTGVHFDVSKYQKVKTVSTDWADITVYFGIERNKSPSHVVLSSGVYQFAGLGKAGSYFKDANEIIPYDIIVNVLPKVQARSAEYPFENSREAFKNRVTSDIDALQAYLSAISRGESAKSLKEGFKNIVSMPRIEVGSELADNSKKLKKAFDKRSEGEVAEFEPLPDEVTIRSGEVIDTKGTVVARTQDAEKQAEKQNKESFKIDKALPDLSTFMADMKANPLQPIFHNNTNVDYLAIGKKYGNPEAFFAELGTIITEMKETLAKSGLYGYEKLSAKDLFFGGISIDRGYSGIHIKVPFNAVLINPFYDWGAKTLFGIRANFYDVMTHEIGHMGNMSHGVGHNTEMTKVRQYLADAGMADYFNDALLDILTRHESTFTAMREAYGKSTTINSAKSFTDIKENSPATSPRGGSAGTDSEPGSVRTGGGQGRSGNLQTSGGSGEQGQVGSGTRGASVKEFPRAGEVVDGRTVREDIPNQSSISASLTDYTVVRGVREIPLSAFDPEYVNSVKLDKLDGRTQKLVRAIKESGEINPLIVVMDSKGLYVLEGGHRFDALIALGAKSLPAQIVIDNESMQEDGQRKRATDRTPELQEGIAKLRSGEITKQEYENLVNENKPVKPYEFVPDPVDPKKARFALSNGKGQSQEKAAKFGLPHKQLKEGDPAQLRLDIPSYSLHGAWVVTVHRPEGKSFGAGKVIGYESVAAVTNAKFGMLESAAQKIAAGSAKGTIATIMGDWKPITPVAAKKFADAALKSNEWVQVGMDPERHSYFYNRATMEPVVSAGEVIQIGPLVLAKNVITANKGQFLFNVDTGSKAAFAMQSKERRAERMAEYASLRRKSAEVQKQMRNVGSTLDTQRLANELHEAGQELKRMVTVTRAPIITPENFLNQARKALDGELPFKGQAISQEVFDVIQAAYQKTPWLLNGLRLSVKAPKTQGVAGNLNPYARIVTLWAGTSGTEDPSVVRHELAHSMEQMMTPAQRSLVIDAWMKDLDNRINKATDQKELAYFQAVIDFIENPNEDTHKIATDLLPRYDLYQYLTPSEYWAVNAEPLLNRQLGGVWEKFKKAMARLFEGLKSVLGFNNKYAVHKVFQEIISGDRERMSKIMLIDFVDKSGFATKFLNTIHDEEKLLAMYNRPNTPMLNTTPIRTALLNGASAAKGVFKAALKDPLGLAGDAVTGVDRALLHARNREIWFGSGLNAADFERYNGELRVSGGLATASVALDNALRGWTMASQVILNGGIEYNQKSLNFVAVKRNKGMAGVYKAEMILKKRLGSQMGTDIVQGYLEAKRSLSIINEVEARQAQVDALLDDLTNMPPGTKAAIVQAKKEDYEEAVADLKSIQRVERKVSMSPQEIEDFIDMETVHPELTDLMDNWNAVNQNMLGFWRQVGLISESRYNLLSGIKDYVPWNRIMEGEATSGGFVSESTLLSSTKSMTNIGMEKIFKSGKPVVQTEFVAKAGQDTFQINPSTVVGATINGVAVNPGDLITSPNGEVKINAPIGAGDIVAFTANREIENMIDNMTRSVMRMTMNGLRQYAAMRTVSEYATRNDKNKIRVFPKVDKKEGTFNFIANGRNIVVQIRDPLIADAVYGLDTIDVAMFRPLILTANVLRRAITLSGVFQLKQVFKDAPTAALVTGVKRPDLLIGGVYKGFVTALLRPMINAIGSKITGKNIELEPVVELLQAAGIGGFHSPSRTPEAAVKLQLGMMNQNVGSFVLKALDHIGDSSDMAQRVATYKRVLKETGDEAQALYQAANVINFLHRGYGAEAQFLAKTVPFMGAYANASDVLVQALAGGGLKGMSRGKAIRRLGITGSLLMGTTLVYLMLAGGDPDYEEQDDLFKMRNYIIPGTKIYLPMNTQAGFLFKGMAEILYNHFILSSTETPHDATRLRTALKEAVVDMLLGPEPLPPIVKTFAEIKFKHNFFTGRPVVPPSLDNLYAVEQYTAATSEAGKLLSSFTGDEKSRLLNPIEADHVIKGLFGTAGSMAMWLSNQMGEAAALRPATPANRVPVIGAFTLPAVGRKNEDLFYDLKERVDKEYKTFEIRLDRMKGEEIAKYKNEQFGLIALHKYITKSTEKLGKLEKVIRIVGSEVDTGQTPKEKRETIEDLQRAKSKVLTGVELFREAAGL